MTWNENKTTIVKDGKVQSIAIRHSEAKSHQNILSNPIIPLLSPLDGQFKNLLNEAKELGTIITDANYDKYLNEFYHSSNPQKMIDTFQKVIHERKEDMRKADELTLSDKEFESALKLSWDEKLNRGICPECTHKLKDGRCLFHGSKEQINMYKPIEKKISRRRTTSK